MIKCQLTAARRGLLTIGTRPRYGDRFDWYPLDGSFPLAWLGQALHRRSRSDFSNRPVDLEAESAAILSKALLLMSLAIAFGNRGVDVRGLLLCYKPREFEGKGKQLIIKSASKVKRQSSFSL